MNGFYVHICLRLPHIIGGFVPDHSNTSPVFRCLVFRWLLYSNYQSVFGLWTILPSRSLHSNLVPILIFCIFIVADVRFDAATGHDQNDEDQFVKLFVDGLTDVLFVNLSVLCLGPRIVSAVLTKQTVKIELFVPRPMETELQVS